MDVSKLTGDSGNIHVWLKNEKQKQSLALAKVVQSVADQAKKNKETKKSRAINDSVVFSSHDGPIRLKGAISRLKSKISDILSSDIDKEQKTFRVSELQRKINGIEVLISDIKRKEREAEQKQKQTGKKFDAYKYVIVQRGDLKSGDEPGGFTAEIGTAAGMGTSMDTGFMSSSPAVSSGGTEGGNVDVEL